MNDRKLNRGFTLLETLIVLAIIAVLLGFAVPQLQDYLVRTKVTEGLQLASAAKNSVVELFTVNGIVPTSNAQANYAGLVGYQGDNVDRIEIIDAGAIQITYKASKINGATLILTPSIGNQALTDNQQGVIEWVCKSADSISSRYGTKGTLLARYAPNSCNQ